MECHQSLDIEIAGHTKADPKNTPKYRHDPATDGAVKLRLATILITRPHSFPQPAEFRVKLRNLPFSTEF